MLLEKYETPSNKQVTRVRLDWQKGRDSIPIWNEICAWAMGEFGLPGSRYEWHPTEDYMYFDFYDERNAIHFMLRWS